MTLPGRDDGGEDDRLRRAWAQREGDPSEACPLPERLWDAARGALAPGEASALVEHTIACASCAEAWRLAREVGSAVFPTTTGRPPAWKGGIALAAAALMGLSLIAVLARRPAAPTPYREGDPGVLRSQVPEDAALPRAACVLRWSGAEAGARYDLRVAREDLVLLHQAQGLASPSHQVPLTALAELPRGAKIVWQVVATNADGTHVTGPVFVARIE